MLRIVLSQSGQQLGAGDYENDLIRIGSSEDSDLQIESPDITPNHAEVWAFNGRCNVRSPDNNVLTISGREITGRDQIEDGEALNIGDFSFVVLIDPQREMPDEKKTYKTGRIMLKGSEMLDLPTREEEEQLILKARRVLVEQGANESQLEDLRAHGAERAQEILQQAEADGLLSTVKAAAAGGARAQSARASSGDVDRKRMMFLIALAILSPVLGGFMIYFIRELMLSFTT